MKTLLIITPHSFVDLITNSSSELFICNTKKSVDAVKKVLVELVKLENQKNNLADRLVTELPEAYEETEEYVFSEFFKEPVISEFSFSQEKFPRYDEYRMVHDYNNDKEDLFELYHDAKQKMHDWQATHPAPAYKNSMTEAEQKAYDDYNISYRAARRKFYKKWETYVKQLELEFYQWAFEEAGLNKNLLTVDFEDEYPSVKISDNVPTKDAADTADDFRHEISMAISYGYNFNKGDILLWSQSDNTVPFGMFDSIEYVLNANRIHAG
jgi:hypothetical protein